MFYFSLWYEPWITFEKLDGTLVEYGLRDGLIHSHELIAIEDNSPLAVYGINRLMIAVAQHMISPVRDQQIIQTWNKRQFSVEQVDAFGDQYADRFDLFSETAPFFQTTDFEVNTIEELPNLKGRENEKIWTVAKLAAEHPKGRNSTHYCHKHQDSHAFCPACNARLLTTLPPFAIIEGSGYTTSINGLNNLYLLPIGDTLFETITLSLLTPNFFPGMASHTDMPWWTRPAPTQVGKTFSLISGVGYIQSLTLIPRRIRLFPESVPGGTCTRCGRPSDVLVRRMYYASGESRPKDSPKWPDPFLSYRKYGKKGELRKVMYETTKPLWRLYAGLFLAESNDELPAVLNHICQLIVNYGLSIPLLRFRCFGLASAGTQAKYFEWLDSGVEVPSDFLTSSGYMVAINATAMAEKGVYAAKNASWFFYEEKLRKEFKEKKIIPPMVMQAEETFWEMLADPFQEFIQNAPSMDRQAAVLAWNDTLWDIIYQATLQTAYSAGNSPQDLFSQAAVECELNKQLARLFKKQASSHNKSEKPSTKRGKKNG